MPIVTFLPSKKTVEVQKDTSLYDAAILAGLPIASSCSANFVCGKCNIQVCEGARHLSALSQAELSLLQRERHPKGDRIACRTYVRDACTITTRYW